ncbi:nucleotide exchange factor GrpE [bacterium]|nr:nucleotide exchange factor GrpE [bacterium]
MQEDFQQTVLRELSALRQEVRQLREALTGVPAAHPTLSPPPALQPTPAWSDLFTKLPASLQKRLQPLLQESPPEAPRQRAQWLLEISENVEDYMRYEGDEWSGAGPFLEQLQDLQERCGLERVVPQEGESVDSRLHLELQTLPNPERLDQIARCARPGFMHEGDLLRRAEVVVYL